MNNKIKIKEIVLREARNLVYRENCLANKAKQELLKTLDENQRRLFSKFMVYSNCNNYMDQKLIVDYCFDFLKITNNYSFPTK